jgi:ribosomal protein L14E/L6E/L27E
MNNTCSLCIGQYVISKMGRDKGRTFIVLEVVDSEFVLVGDGDLRKVEKPKRKKIRHLQPTKTISESVRSAASDSVKITNLMLRGEIEKQGI